MANDEILIESKTGLAYCRPYYSEHDATRDVLRYLNDEGFHIDIRLACWQRLNSAISAELKLLNHLLDEATRLLSNLDPAEALAKFKSDVLTESNLYGSNPPEINFDDNYAPEVGNLQAAIDEMGLDDFRVYAHDLLEVCPKAQSELDLMIRERYEPSAQDPWPFTANAARVLEERQVEVVEDAYIWSSNFGTCFIVIEESDIYKQRKAVLDGDSDNKLKIVSPNDIQAEIT